jgi:extradiol dioxygenase family protein
MTTHLPAKNYPCFHLAFPVADLGQARCVCADISLLFAKNR